MAEQHELVGHAAHMLQSRTIIAGLDLGKVQDHSALVVNEVCKYYLGLALIGETPSYVDAYGVYHQTEPKYEQRFRTVYTVRHIEHFPLELQYHAMAERLGDIFANLRVPPDTRRILTIEENLSGVSEIVQEKLKARQDVGSVQILPVMTTAGRQVYRFGEKTCSKYYMISRLLQLMGAEVPELEIPSDLQAFIPTLLELRNFQEKVAAESGNQSFSGKAGVHDDLVMALALSVLVDPDAGKIWWSNRIF